jgi:Protein of unknown function (DUF3017)
MADRPANAGSGSAGPGGAGMGNAGPGGVGMGSAGSGSVGPGSVGPGSVGPGRGLAPMGDVTPPGITAFPAETPSRPAETPRPAAGHRATRPRTPNHSPVHADVAVGALAWVPYLIVLAGAALGLSLAVRGPKYAGLGTGVLGGALLVGALARLVLPERYAGLLATRRKASDVLAFAAFGAAVLAVALTLP